VGRGVVSVVRSGFGLGLKGLKGLEKAGTAVMVEQKKDSYLIRHSYIPLLLILVLLAGVVLYEGQKRKLAGKLLLLDTRVERTAGEKAEVVSRVRFIAKAAVATAVFLPAGDEYRAGISFVPVLERGGSISLSKAVYVQEFSENRTTGNSGAQSLHPEANGGNVEKLSGEVGQDIVFVRGSRGSNKVRVEYAVVVTCEKVVDAADLKRIGSSLVEVDGETLHQVNMAIPELMSAGVEP
jgi:hypothetical protein